MNIKFLSEPGGRWPHTGDRDASNVQRVIQAAVHDAVVPSKRDVVMDQESTEYEWSYMGNFLWIFPQTLDKPPLTKMTWGMWADALRGIDEFRLAYPGVLVIFHVYVYPVPGPRTPEGEIYIGHGRLEFERGRVRDAAHAQSKRTERLE